MASVVLFSRSSLQVFHRSPQTSEHEGESPKSIDVVYWTLTAPSYLSHLHPKCEQQLVSTSEMQAHEDATMRGAIEGTVVGATLAGLAHLALPHRFPAYRAIPGHLKMLGAMIIIIPCFAVQSERRGLQFDRAHWSGESATLLEEKQRQEELRWSRLSMTQKVKEYCADHTYTLIVGGWAGSLALAGSILWQDKYMTKAQKVVQARMWAQGLAIGMLIVAGALSASSRSASKEQQVEDHSWRDIIEFQEREHRIAQGVVTRTA
ncbi:hypothetical protein FISHEDRAFT_69781 [Fistulina hepatica ATCC 64428]|uniref:HIG1 domain-containing protein n=1 Tax=Fistulina hepatica ATCC 64428 TaxID=1128425 RepID=A0A0D7ALQ0_9AGAR|nr:hypothetical protein FISHEDRAFT_69781 [Fistulina hepatica ATCC 64428]